MVIAQEGQDPRGDIFRMAAQKGSSCLSFGAKRRRSKMCSVRSPAALMDTTSLGLAILLQLRDGDENTFIIARRELGAYFNSPIAYVVVAVFLLPSALLFFSALFLQGQADLRELFDGFWTTLLWPSSDRPSPCGCSPKSAATTRWKCC